MSKKNISAALRKRNLQRSESAVLKKGMELPINTLVVVAIAVIVILAIAAFFMGGFGGSSKDIQNRQAFLNACSSWVQTGCNNADFTSSIEDTFKVWQPTVDLESLTDLQNNKVDKKDYLAGKCGCFGAGTGTRSPTTNNPSVNNPANPVTPPTTTTATCASQSGTCDDTTKCISGTDKAVKSSDCTATGKSCCIKGGASTGSTGGTCKAYPSTSPTTNTGSCPTGTTPCIDPGCIPSPAPSATLCCK